MASDSSFPLSDNVACHEGIGHSQEGVTLFFREKPTLRDRMASQAALSMGMKRGLRWRMLVVCIFCILSDRMHSLKDTSMALA